MERIQCIHHSTFNYALYEIETENHSLLNIQDRGTQHCMSSFPWADASSMAADNSKQTMQKWKMHFSTPKFQSSPLCHLCTHPSDCVVRDHQRRCSGKTRNWPFDQCSSIQMRWILRRARSSRKPIEMLHFSSKGIIAGQAQKELLFSKSMRTRKTLVFSKLKFYKDHTQQNCACQFYEEVKALKFEI